MIMLTFPTRSPSTHEQKDLCLTLLRQRSFALFIAQLYKFIFMRPAFPNFLSLLARLTLLACGGGKVLVTCNVDDVAAGSLGGPVEGDRSTTAF